MSSIMQNFTLVSVIIPTFRRSGLLRTTLESISKQTYKNFEVIVVDDGSPNDDAELVCGDFNFCIYTKIENSGGPAKPRNIGIDLAKGKYFAFVDDDDLWYPEKLEFQVAILEKEPDFGLVHCYCECIDETGSLTGVIVGRPGSPDVKHGDCFLKMIGNWTIMMPTPLIRAELVKKINGFNPFINGAMADVEFFTRLSLHTKFWFIDKSLVLYRVHGGNISGNSENYKDLQLSLSRVAEDAYLTNKISLEDLFIIQRRFYFKFLYQDGKLLDASLRKKRLNLLRRSYSFLHSINLLYFHLNLLVKPNLKKLVNFLRAKN